MRARAQIVILTGTPGTGKNTIARRLRRYGYKWISLGGLIEEERLWTKIEEGAKVADMRALQRRVNEIIAKAKKESEAIVIEGHLACEIKISADLCIVLRTHPKILKKRLAARGYPKYKIQRNIECEFLGHCTQMAEKNLDCPIYEIKSDKPLAKTMREIKAILAGKNAKFKSGWVNWTGEIDNF